LPEEVVAETQRRRDEIFGASRPDDCPIEVRLSLLERRE
jgi:hypothetical protein